MTRELVLASTSRYRRSLLERLGVPFDAVTPDCDERSLDDAGLSVEAQALALARAKADSVAAVRRGAFVLGSDQIVEIDGERLGKPGSAEVAVAQLGRLSGRTHRIVTAVTLRRPDGAHDEHVDVHDMTMRRLDRAALAAYVELERPLDCAGAYKIESAGLLLFEAVVGRDPTAVIGLPLLAVARLLERAGFVVPPRLG